MSSLKCSDLFNLRSLWSGLYKICVEGQCDVSDTNSIGFLNSIGFQIEDCSYCAIDSIRIRSNLSEDEFYDVYAYSGLL